ncbi:hypothetical protein GCM10020229_41300 [Kitasatospora albolonga]
MQIPSTGPGLTVSLQVRPFGQLLRGPQAGSGLSYMFVGTLTFDLLLGDVHSLKEKRSIVRPIVAELARKYSVCAAEVGNQDLHRRAEIGLAVVSGDAGYVTEVLDSCERLVAGRPEVMLLSARRRYHGDDDD